MKGREKNEVTVSTPPAFLLLGHHVAHVHLLRATALLLGSFRPMGGNGSLLLLALEYCPASCWFP